MSLQITDCEDLPTLADEYGYGEPILDKIALWTGDITRIKCDAIVNAANKDLKGGGGIDGAIHRAAGHAALKELTAGFPKPLATGAVALTTAVNIKHAKYIMHAVGPQINPPFRNPTDLEQKQLRSCYWAALNYLIDKPDYFKTKGPIKTIAFPCISTGIFGYKPDLAAELVVISIFRWLIREEGYKHVDKIILVLWDNKDKACYNNALKAWVPKTIGVMKEFGLIIDEPASKKSKESQNDDNDAEEIQSSGDEEEKEEQQSSTENEGRADASVNNNSSEDDEVANEEEEEDQESDVRAESETEGEGPAAENETEEVDTSDSN